MTDQQKRFAEEYVVDLDAAAAARRAGYAAAGARSVACRLRQRPEIARLIDAELARRAEKTGISAEYVITSLKELADRCMDEESFNAAGACKALELLGRHLKLFTDRQEQSVSGPGGGPVETNTTVTVNFVRAMPHQ